MMAEDDVVLAPVDSFRSQSRKTRENKYSTSGVGELPNVRDDEFGKLRIDLRVLVRVLETGTER
jgi:hypothetical protein